VILPITVVFLGGFMLDGVKGCSSNPILLTAKERLEKAKQLADEHGQDAAGICQVPFSVYVRTGQKEKTG